MMAQKDNTVGEVQYLHQTEERKSIKLTVLSLNYKD